jgi:hypothetical protein
MAARFGFVSGFTAAAAAGAAPSLTAVITLPFAAASSPERAGERAAAAEASLASGPAGRLAEAAAI